MCYPENPEISAKGRCEAKFVNICENMDFLKHPRGHWWYLCSVEVIARGETTNLNFIFQMSVLVSSKCPQAAIYKR